MLGLSSSPVDSRGSGNFYKALGSMPRYKKVAEFMRKYPSFAVQFMEILNEALDRRRVQEYKFTEDDMRKDFGKLKLAEQIELLEQPKFQVLYSYADEFLARAEKKGLA